MERWQMNRLGFVNFWVYDIEEFPIYGGRLLLRGANGSGKSITTQSFIPYMDKKIMDVYYCSIY